MGTVPVDRPATASVSYWKLWRRFAITAGWLLVAATISLVPPKPRRPAGELPMWKLLVWLLLLFALAVVVALTWRSG